MKPRAMLANMKKQHVHEEDSRIRVRIGMATCGLSAGADAVHDAFVEAVAEVGLDNVDVIATGCVGRCDLEPMAEVTQGAEPPVLYVKLNAEKAKEIVRSLRSQL